MWLLQLSVRVRLLPLNSFWVTFHTTSELQESHWSPWLTLVQCQSQNSVEFAGTRRKLQLGSNCLKSFIIQDKEIRSLRMYRLPWEKRINSVCKLTTPTNRLCMLTTPTNRVCRVCTLTTPTKHNEVVYSRPISLYITTQQLQLFFSGAIIISKIGYPGFYCQILLLFLLFLIV